MVYFYGKTYGPSCIILNEYTYIKEEEYIKTRNSHSNNKASQSQLWKVEHNGMSRMESPSVNRP